MSNTQGNTMKFISNTKYIITEQGEVINSETSSILKHMVDRNGYHYVNLSTNNNLTTYRIHRLVAENFVRGFFVGATVNHIDGIKSHNCVSNLEWVSLKANIQHAYALGLSKVGQDRQQALLDDSDVSEIKEGFVIGTPNKELAERYGVHKSTIQNIKSGRAWAHIRKDLKWICDNQKKLDGADIPIIREAIGAGQSDPDIAILFGVTRGTIRQIRVGNTWKNY